MQCAIWKTRHTKLLVLSHFSTYWELGRDCSVSFFQAMQLAPGFLRQLENECISYGSVGGKHTLYVVLAFLPLSLAIGWNNMPRESGYLD